MNQNSDASFSKRLAQRIDTIGSRLCVGIDPHLVNLAPFFQEQLSTLSIESFLNHFSDALIAGAEGQAAILKFQSAFYEAHGAKGVQALGAALQRAKAAGFLTLLDAKRGDIASTMEAYGQMAFEALAADALTITPYMGFDVIAPLTRWLKSGCGAYVVWITSNPSGSAVQNLNVLVNGKTQSFSAVLLDYILDQAAQTGLGEALGFVLGATKLEHLDQELLQRVAPYPLLFPGIGPQGGRIDSHLLTLLQGSPTSVVTMSRAISGWGDPEQAGALSAVKSWRDYRSYIERRVKNAQFSLS